MQTWEEQAATQAQFLSLMRVQAVADELDQLRSDARDAGLGVVDGLLAEAWYHAEKELRDVTGECSSLRHGRGRCECCAEFRRLQGRIRR